MEVAASAEAVALVEVVAFAGAASVRTGFPVRVAVSAISICHDDVNFTTFKTACGNLHR